jgi:hypothetical protein
MLACDTPGQSLVVSLASGLLAGGFGLSVGFGPLAVAALAGAFAVAGELAAHAVRGDEQWRAAVASIR